MFRCRNFKWLSLIALVAVLPVLVHAAAGDDAARKSLDKRYPALASKAIGTSSEEVIESVLEIVTENNANYRFSPGTPFSPVASATGIPFASPFLVIGDIVSVNGDPAKGTWVFRGVAINASPNAQPGLGQAIADASFLAQADHSFNIQEADGNTVGTIYGLGMDVQVSLTIPFGAPPPVPGQLPGINASNFTIVGGSGAYIGASGQFGNALTAGPVQLDAATADPANRRVDAAASAPIAVLMRLTPRAAPSAVIVRDGPRNRTALFHDDRSLVTGDNPAQPGETLRLVAQNLGPTTAILRPGQRFPADSAVTSPVYLRINGQRVDVDEAVGIDGTSDFYEVVFQVPVGITESTRARLFAAWLKGTTFSIPIG